GGLTSAVSQVTTRAVTTAVAAANRSTRACSTTPSALACTPERNIQITASSPNTTLPAHSAHHNMSSRDGSGRWPGGRPSAASTATPCSSGTSRPAYRDTSAADDGGASACSGRHGAAGNPQRGGVRYRGGPV